MRVELRTVAATIVLILTSAWPAAAQTTFATITGTVTDSSGGVIAGAEVAATNVETSIATGAIQQAGMRSMRLGIRAEW